MKILVEYSAQAKHFAGMNSETIEVNSPCTVWDLVKQLALVHGDPLGSFLLDAQENIASTIIFTVNGEHIFRNAKYELNEGDIVHIMSPIAGV